MKSPSVSNGTVAKGAIDWELLKQRTAAALDRSTETKELDRVFLERAAALARSGADSAEKEGTTLLVFTHGAMRFAVELEAVARVLRPRPLTRVPNTAQVLDRVLHERGRIVAALDPSALFGAPIAPDGKEPVVLLQDDGVWLGVRATRVQGTKRYEERVLAPASASLDARAASAVRGVADDMTIVLDGKKLIHDFEGKAPKRNDR